MSLTPLEIRTAELERARVGGYRRQAVDELLDEIADSLAGVMRERDELSERTEVIGAEQAQHRELETLLRSTLVSAERAAQETKAQARRESDLIVQEAHAEARRVTREAAAEKRRIEEDTIAIQARLRAALEQLGGSEAAPSVNEQEATSETTTPELGEVLESGIRKVVA